ncbi:MAG: hypothetical protein H6747_09560 [Deltaproteobacteria bacterium]|nr:hypothetical protein [Deltaproteobacteria bacterium]
MSAPTSAKPPDLHSLIEGLAQKIDALASSTVTSDETRAQISSLRADVDRLLEAEAAAKETTKARRRLAVAGAAALASVAGGTSEHWLPLVRALVAAFGV